MDDLIVKHGHEEAGKWPSPEFFEKNKEAIENIIRLPPSAFGIKRNENNPKIQHIDPLDRLIRWSNIDDESFQSRNARYLNDELGQFPASFTTTRELTPEEFQADIENMAKHFNTVKLYEPTIDGQKRIDDLKKLKFGERLDRSQPHWEFLNKK